jgi:hypothetical protein
MDIQDITKNDSNPAGIEAPLEYRPMAIPLVLYRSVSPQELAHVLSTGAVTGGLNRFNGFDPRREVFFGSVLSDKLMWQGEEISRRVENALADHPLQDKYKKALEKRRNLSLERKNEFEIFMPPAVRRQSKKISDDIDKIQNAFRAILKLKLEEEHQKNEERPFTCAVLETRPIMGDRHYSKNHEGGRSGMGDEDEYGFNSGQVRLTDVVAIHLRKNREHLKTVLPDAEGVFHIEGIPKPRKKKATAPK